MLEIPGRTEPVDELTSSSLTHSWANFPGEPNRHRVGEAFSDNSFGLLEIDWQKREATVSVCEVAGVARRELVLKLSPYDIPFTFHFETSARTAPAVLLRSGYALRGGVGREKAETRLARSPFLEGKVYRQLNRVVCGAGRQSL